MNIRDCEYIIALDEVKSFIKAAHQCYISQPALSQQIKKVEGELGVKIFERNNKTIITTTKGKLVVKNAKAIVDNFVQMKAIKAGTKDIKIGFIPTICPYLLPHLTDQLNEKLADIKFYFLEQKTEDLIAGIEKGTIDIGVVAYFDHLIDKRLEFKKLYQEEFVLVMPANSTKNADDLPEILKNKELILLAEGNCLSDNIKDICAAYSISSFNDFYATNIETIKNMIKIGNGVGLLPKLSCLDSEKLKVIELGRDKKREIGLVYRKNFEEKQLLRTIEQIIKQVARKLLKNS